ncbi:hypothetical protein [Actinacidiphila oryziradicis]|uniref:hypothetical protein n=1 Tax=Actinacidiphila oryziradicis TaxID=2571141 RepID=UPI0023F36BA2|nr:hypothetical protein [Actinacidiphila oryziradicis]MCW2873009.1 hypothetical protein [Actinacidiphila oryziradicis]
MPVPSITSLTGLVRRQPVVIGGAVAAAVVVARVTVLLTGGGTGRPRADNVSRNFRACLLVSPANATDARLAKAAWEGMQDAAKSGHVNAQRFPTPTIDAKAALPYFNGTVQQHCGVIITVGTGMKPATEAAATANPHQEFAVVGAASTRPHISAIAASDSAKDLAGKVETFITRRA